MQNNEERIASHGPIEENEDCQLRRSQRNRQTPTKFIFINYCISSGHKRMKLLSETRILLNGLQH